jgi:hypothetical protein
MAIPVENACAWGEDGDIERDDEAAVEYLAVFLIPL